MTGSFAAGALILGALTAQSVPGASPAPSPTPSPIVSPSPGPLAATPASLGIPPNGFGDLTIAGAAGAVVATADRGLVTVTVIPSAQTVHVVAGAATGNDTVRVADASGAQIAIPIRVAPYAATLAQSLSLEVTGTPADGAWLAAQIGDLVRRSTQLQPGARATYGPPAGLPATLAPGDRASLTVPVTVAGGDAYLDVAGATTVDVRNVALGAFSPTLLLYDDDPERIAGDGVLYRATVTADRPVRLYYYHDSDAARHRFVAVLSATTAEPTPVHIVAATAGPNPDVMTVGHNASRAFVLSKLRDQGVVVTLPSEGGYPLADVVLGGGSGIAGAIDVRVLGGGPAELLLLAVPEGADAAAVAQIALQAPLPRDGHQRTGVFRLDGGYGTAYRNYVAGGPDVSIVYADQGPPPAAGTAGRDAGDYGVLQTLSFSLDNPTDAPATAYLYERPIGGPVRSTFFLDGTPVEMGCARLSTERYQISSYTLAPHATVPVTIQTMTDGGSNYPIEVGASATPPLPATPAIDAPNGCFPKGL